MTDIYRHLIESKAAGRKAFAVLIDPDRTNTKQLDKIIELGVTAHIDYWLIGGSLIINDVMTEVLTKLKSNSDIPTVLFPGSTMQVHPLADAILLLSLISGRNPELLIGHHVQAAPVIKDAGLEVLSTGYMIIDGGVDTTVAYMSNTRPIPRGKTDIAYCTALAGQMLGMRMIYMDAGSGARHHVPLDMISRVSDAIDIPLVVGGGIRDAETAGQIVASGADLVVVGNAIEKDPQQIIDISAVVHSHSSTNVVNG